MNNLSETQGRFYEMNQAGPKRGPGSGGGGQIKRQLQVGRRGWREVISAKIKSNKKTNEKKMT